MGYGDHHVRSKARKGGEREAFDRWLRRSLREAHDDIIAEPVPDTLLAILREASPSEMLGRKMLGRERLDRETPERERPRP